LRGGVALAVPAVFQTGRCGFPAVTWPGQGRLPARVRSPSWGRM